jgi:tRNA(fMet)-specific endonuclease VapC
MPLRYLLDTNVLSEPMRPEPHPNVLARLLSIGDEAATAAPCWHEIHFGRLRLPKGKRRGAIDRIVRGIEPVLTVLPYDARAARWHARERARLVKKGTHPPCVEGQIAAIAAINDLVLVTRNERDFARFRGLRTENWFV